MKKSVSILLLAALLFQSCVVYQKTSVSISEATDSGKVMVVDDLGTHKYKSIELNNGFYYGLNTPDTLTIKMPIYVDKITAIYLKDIKKSKKRTKGLVVGLAFGSVGLVFLGAYIAWVLNGSGY